MKTRRLNLFIVDNHRSIAARLKNYLYHRFGETLNISTFDDGKNCLRNLNKQTDVVIVDHDQEDKKEVEFIHSIKAINPDTEIIMLMNDQDLNSFRTTYSKYIVKNTNALKRLSAMISRLITEPLRTVIREYGVSKFMVIFFLTFFSMGMIVYFFLNYFNWTHPY